MEEFQTEDRNQINIAILGAVSAGKSTLLNSVFSETYSQCKIIRTTMVPQVYYEFSNKKRCKDLIQSIRQENENINKKIREMNKETLTQEDIKEVNYIVPKVQGFTELEKKVFLSIYDIPGLNDGETDDLYYNYVDSNFYKFDIIIFVVDINSALNSKEERHILEKIVTNCKNNFENNGISNKLIILANKCDEMSFVDSKPILEGEHMEMYSQMEKVTESTIDRIYPDLEYSIIPVSVEDSYIYRMFEKDKNFQLDDKYLTKFGSNEFGKSKWRTTKPEQRRKMVEDKIKEFDIPEMLKMTGWDIFTNKLNDFLTPDNQKLFISNHLIYELTKINGNNILDISDDIEKFRKLYKRCEDVEKRIKKGVDTFNIFKIHFTKYLEGYKQNVLNQYLHSTPCELEVFKKIKKSKTNRSDDDYDLLKYESCYRIKDVKKYDNVLDIEKILSKAVSYFDNKVEILSSLYKYVVDALACKHINDILGHKNTIPDMFNTLTSLVDNNFEITDIIITAILSNPNMYEQTPQDIIKFMEELEVEGFIDESKKSEYILEILKNIYEKMKNNHNISGNYLSPDLLHYYRYFTHIFWNKVILQSRIMNPHLLQISNLCNTNYWWTKSLERSPSSDLSLNEIDKLSKYEDCLVLENYYLSLN